MNTKLLVFLYILIISSNAFAQLFPSYTNINTNSIQPYYLSMVDNTDKVKDVGRRSNAISYINLTSYIGDSRFFDEKSDVEQLLDELVQSIPSWNEKLDFIASLGSSSTKVLRIFNLNSSLETFITVRFNSINCMVYPLDNNYKLELYDYLSVSFSGDAKESFAAFIETISDQYYIVEVRIGDVDTDEMVYAFLAEGDPIYQNKDGNLEIVGYYGDSEVLNIYHFIF